MDLWKFQAPAKINLTLEVEMPALPSVFSGNELRHRIQSEILKISLYDELRLEKTVAKKITLKISGPWAKGIPNNRENLAFQAAERFFIRTGFSAGVRIDITKNIPARSGLGGGSSDAAGVLRSLAKLFPEKAGMLSAEDWQGICMGLGSDVPFFFSPLSYAVVSGFGEVIRKKEFSLSPQPIGLVLAMLPRISASTAWSYAALDRAFSKSPERFKQVSNHFEIPLFDHFPDLRHLRDALMGRGASYVSLTGSGAALFAFFEDRKEMKSATTALRETCAFWQELRLSDEAA